MTEFAKRQRANRRN